MRQKKVKAIRREIRKDATAMYSAYEYRAANKDLENLISKIGIEKMIQARGYAPITCFLKEGCLKLEYKKAKKLVT